MTGLEFGKLPVHIRRIVRYSLSSYEQRALKNFFSAEIPNMCKRGIAYLPSIAPAFLFVASIAYWAEKRNYLLQRKNPDDYKDDI